jgi:hypothetical protein
MRPPKIRGIFISVAILVVLAVLSVLHVRQVFESVKSCDTDFMFNKKDKFLWMFDSSIRSNAKCEYAIGNELIGKYRFLYTYEDKYRYVIFADSGINNVSLHKIDGVKNSAAFDMNASSENNEMGWGGDFQYQSKMCIGYSTNLTVNISSKGSVKRSGSSKSVQFSGLIENLAIENETHQTEYLIRLGKPILTNVIFYKPENILYIIIVNPFQTNPEDNNGISHLDL